MRAISDPLSLDLYNVRGSSAIIYIGPVVNNLITENPYKPGEIIPELAERWEVSSDSKTVTFFLRAGVLWHDGKPFTSADALYNLQRAWKPPTPDIGTNASVFKSVINIEAPDDRTVRVTLAQPSAAFIPAIAQPTMAMYPAHIPDMKVWQDNPIGTGPFIWKSYVRAQSIDYVRNDKYFKPGLPYLDGINQVFVLDNAAAYAALKLGQVDVSSPMDTTALSPHLDSIQQEIPDIQNFPGTGARYDFYLNQRPPLTDPRVRLAIHLGVDRKTVVDLWYSAGRGTVPVAGLYPTNLGGLWGLSQDELRQMPGFREKKDEDLARAKQLLADAGVAPGTKLQVMVGTFQAAGAPAIKAVLDKIGFNAQLLIEDAAPSAARLRSGDYDIFLSSIPAYYDDPASNLSTIATSTGPVNYGKWSFPEIDALTAQQDATLDAAKRAPLIRQLQFKVIEAAHVITIFWSQNQMAWHSWVKNQPHWTTTLGPQWRFDQVWLDRT